MATTKYKIAEQIIRLLKGSDNPNASNVRLTEVVQLVGQVINRLLKVEHYQIMSEAGMSPNGLVIATYDNQTVTTYKTNFSQVTLPAVPVRLVKNMGVFHIGATDQPFVSFIPIETGLFQMVSAEPLISDVLGQIAYEVNGDKVTFTTDITAGVPAITAVLIKLVVLDVKELTDYDPLPIPADMEATVITEALKLLSVKAAPVDKDDVVTETRTQPQPAA